MVKKGADKVLSDMMEVTQRHNNKMMALVSKQAEHLEVLEEIANVMQAAAVAEDARIGPVADDEQICADGDDHSITIADSDPQLCIAVVKGAQLFITVHSYSDCNNQNFFVFCLELNHSAGEQYHVYVACS